MHAYKLIAKHINFKNFLGLAALCLALTFGLNKPSLAQEDIPESENIVVEDIIQEIPQPTPSSSQSDNYETFVTQPEPIDYEDTSSPEATAQEQPIEGFVTRPTTPEGQPEQVTDTPPMPVEELPSELTPEAPALTEAANPPLDENLFFDAEALVPESQLSTKGSPSKVNPRVQPASTFVVVTQDAGPDSAQAQLVAANRAMSLGRFESAIDIYDSILAKNSKDVGALMGKAVAYQRLGQDEYAIQAYESVLNERPKNLAARVNMQGIIGQKYPAVALKNLMDIRADNPGDVGVLAQIAVVQANLEQYEEAIRSLGIAASMEPKNPGHVYNMAIIADRAGVKEEAIKFYEQALEIDTLYGKSSMLPREAIFERLASLR